jgi:hypothetical protein
MTRRIVLSEDESDSDTPLRAAVKADLPIGANGAASNGHGKRKHSSTISAAAASPSSVSSARTRTLGGPLCSKLVSFLGIRSSFRRWLRESDVVVSKMIHSLNVRRKAMPRRLVPSP